MIMPHKMPTWEIVTDCQGGCDFHYGEVKKVTISMKGNPFDGMEYNYCKRAIEKDIARGYEINEPHFEKFGE